MRRRTSLVPASAVRLHAATSEPQKLRGIVQTLGPTVTPRKSVELDTSRQDKKTERNVWRPLSYRAQGNFTGNERAGKQPRRLGQTLKWNKPLHAHSPNKTPRGDEQRSTSKFSIRHKHNHLVLESDTMCKIFSRWSLNRICI